MNPVTQIQVSRSVPTAAVIVGQSVFTKSENPENIPFVFFRQATSKPGHFPLLAEGPPFYFVDAPNVSTVWNIKNASLVIRQLNLAAQVPGFTGPAEWEFTIEYQIKSAGVILLAAIEKRKFIKVEGSGETEGIFGNLFKELGLETIVNYEAIRDQLITPGSGLELSINLRNISVLTEPKPETWSLRIEPRIMELLLGIESTYRGKRQ